ncbi:MAG TPA: ABC transporter permease [Stellaceae bacterium]|nr:ABC transporter permease [Stellaceae bacterium]
MEFLLEQLLNGVVYGMLLFLMAAGLSLIFGLMNVVSLAHGSFFMLGAFVALTIFRVTHSFWLAFLIAPIPITVLGMAMEAVFLRPLYRRNHLDQVLLTFGFTFIFLDAVQTFWGRDIFSISVPAELQGAVDLGFGVYPIYRLFLIALGAVLALVLWLVLERSRLGAMVRAGVDDSAMAAGLGGNVPALFTGVFGGGVALAALGGVAAAPILGIYAGLDTDILIPAFIVIVVGGMGSLRGAFIGSLLIGEADTFGKAYLPDLSLFFIYLVMAVVLLARPQGIFGIARVPSPTVPAISAPAPVPAHRKLVLGLIVAAAMAAFPLFVTDYVRALVGELFIFAIVAMSLDLLLGYTGLPSLGHAAFFGLGAYFVIVLAALFGVDTWVGVALGVVAAAAMGALIGYFCVRVSGVSFLMLTLAFSQLVYSIVVKWRAVTGGSDGLSIPERSSFFGFDLSNSLTMYYMLLLFLVLCYLVLRQIVNSPLGLVFIGIRENEGRMRAVGYSSRAYKILSFTIGAGFAGLAGGLYAIYNGFVSPDTVYWSASGDVLIMTMLGGTGTLIGPAIGAGVYLLMKNLISSYTPHWPFIIGVIFVACVLYFPSGIWGALRRVRLGGRR